MRAGRFLLGCFLAATLVSSAAAAWSDNRHGGFIRATGTRLGPFVREAWGPEWGYYGGWPYAAGGVSAYPPTDEWYPLGYVAPFVRVGSKCVANEINVSPGGAYVRYQRVRPAHYCN
ncbi:MAG: hypothetical protein CTY15_04855 [Methylocystis sp.]|nr:MAG: hypothetical protein CTY15_04855 [Methylocystis sp.]